MRSSEFTRPPFDVLADDGIKVLLEDGRSRFERGRCLGRRATSWSGSVPIWSARLSRRRPLSSRWRLATRNETSPSAGGNVIFAPVGGPPHAIDLDRGRRAGTLEDFDDLLRLSQAYDVIHVTSQQVEPQDVLDRICAISRRPWPT